MEDTVGISDMKSYRVAVQPLNPNRFSNGGRETTGYSTAQYHETVVQARNINEARSVAAAPHGGERNCEIRVLGEIR